MYRKIWYLLSIQLFSIFVLCIYAIPAYAQFGQRRSNGLGVIGTLVVGLLITAVVFLILREVVCWYWKINERLGSLASTRDAIRDLQRETESANSKHQESLNILRDMRAILQELLEHQKKVTDVLTSQVPLSHSSFDKNSEANPAYSNSSEYQPIDNITLNESIAEDSISDTARQKYFRVLFSGQLQPGKILTQVKQNFVELYQNKYAISDVERIFFSGRAAVIKTQLTYQDALKVQQNFTNRTGGVFTVQEERPLSTDRRQIEIQAIKRDAVSEVTAKIADNQKLDDDTLPVKVIRTDNESEVSSENLKTFYCPWCHKAYKMNIHGSNAIFQCIKCHKGVFIMMK